MPEISRLKISVKPRKDGTVRVRIEGDVTPDAARNLIATALSDTGVIPEME